MPNENSNKPAEAEKVKANQADPSTVYTEDAAEAMRKEFAEKQEAAKAEAIARLTPALDKVGITLADLTAALS